MLERIFKPTPAMKTVWRFLRPVLVLVIAVGVTYGLFTFALNYVLERYISPVDINDATPVILEVENNDSASKIANMLYAACGEGEPGLISNKAVFKVYVDFVGKANKLQAGTYVLSRNMDIPQIVDIICAGNPPKREVDFYVQEGYTISGVIWSLGNAGIAVDEAEFLRLCNDAQAFSKYEFLTPVLHAGDKRDYLLEGYLFPDTYKVFEDVKPETVINRMLVRFNEIFTDEYIERAQELDMTIDEVVTLASIIECEASADSDFTKVSAVFHNRLRDEEKLESCATMQYVLKVKKYVYTDAELATVSPYNTYMYDGLPVGPISNPGKRALEAALYPDETYIEEKYKFFCTQNPEDTKELAYAKTYEEHQENVDRFSRYW